MMEFIIADEYIVFQIENWPLIKGNTTAKIFNGRRFSNEILIGKGYRFRPIVIIAWLYWTDR